MTDCLFCKIVRRENQARIEYEDAEILAFPDLYPKAPIHILVVPKKHIPSIMELDEADAPLIGRLFVVAKKIAEAKGLDNRGYRLTVNCGPEGGQHIYHVHLHLTGGGRR